MKHWRNLILKFLILGIVAVLVLPFYTTVTTWQTLGASLVIAIIAYAISNLVILPRYGGISALVSDAIIFTLILWAMPFIMPGVFMPFTAAVITGVVAAVAEWIFIRYLQVEPVGNVENK